LTIGARKGTFPGMVRQRRLDLVLMNRTASTQKARSVTYRGSRTVVSFAR
jgi:hypothetical protein